MSGQVTNSFFFNRKNKDWTSKTLAKSPPPTSDRISFLLEPLPPSKVDVICVSLLCRNIFIYHDVKFFV